MAQLVCVLAVRRGALRNVRSITGRRTAERIDGSLTAVLLGRLVVHRRLEVAAQVVWLWRAGRLVEGRSIGEGASGAMAEAAGIAVLKRAQAVGAGRSSEDSLVGDGAGSKDVRGFVRQGVCCRDQLDGAGNLGTLDALAGSAVQIRLVATGSPSGGEGTDERHICGNDAVKNHSWIWKSKSKWGWMVTTAGSISHVRLKWSQGYVGCAVQCAVGLSCQVPDWQDAIACWMSKGDKSWLERMRLTGTQSLRLMV